MFALPKDLRVTTHDNSISKVENKTKELAEVLSFLGGMG